MPDTPLHQDAVEQAAAARRFRIGLRLHEIEGNPLDAEDLAMFEMCEREGWSPARRREYILAQARGRKAG